MDAEIKSVMYVISIMSKDRAGIIADVSQKISQMSGDIADIRQSVLCGYFTMILMVSFPISLTQGQIEARLNEIDATKETGLAVSIKQVVEPLLATSSTFPENTYVLTVTGHDQIGFVAAVSAFCTLHAINILDLSTTRKADQYVMILFIDLTHADSVKLIRADLKEFATSSGFNVALQHYNLFRAVNEINLPVV